MSRISEAGGVPMPCAVDVHRVTKQYGDVVAVNDVSLQVEEGSVTGVLGPNGAGKTTLLRMLFGLVRPDSGELRVFGKSWAADGRRVLDGVGGFIESPKLYPYLSGRQNLEGLALLDGVRNRALIDEVLKTVGLENRQNDRLRTYSFGMRQRLGVAASLLRSPQLLVLDEPSNGLDPAGIRDMRALIEQLAADGLTVLISSHDLHEVEEICDHVVIMRKGSVLYNGSIENLRNAAPASGYRIVTTDNDRARVIAEAAGTVRIVDMPDEALLAYGTPREVDEFLRAVITEGLGLRRLEPDSAPLESLFFLLTEEQSAREEQV